VTRGLPRIVEKISAKMDRRASLSKRLRTTATQLPILAKRELRKRIAKDLRDAARKLDALEKHVARVYHIAERIERSNPELAEKLYKAIGEY